MSPPPTNPLLSDWQLWSKGPEALLAIDDTLLTPDESGNGFTANVRIPAGRRLVEDPTITLAKATDDTSITEAIYFDSITGPSLATSSLALNFTHSCSPNAAASVGKEGTLKIHAIKDISKGEAVTLSYLGEDALITPSTDHLSKLKTRYGVTCTCPICSLPPDEQEARDALITDYLTATTTAQDESKTLTERLSANKKRHDLSLKLASYPLLPITRDVVLLLSSDANRDIQKERRSIHTLAHLRRVILTKGSDNPEAKALVVSLRTNKLPKSYNGEDAFLLRASEFEAWLWGDDEVLGNPSEVDDMLMQFSKTKPANRMRIKGEEESDEEQYEDIEGHEPGYEEDEEDEEEFFVRLWKKMLIPKKVVDAYIDELERDMYGFTLGESADDGPACA
ncbi:hypothetical protein BJ508DRAFT_375246 [Ascobolus immersus RN42]|uniref:SET domain-containing protein n=1 Tax=Ascobolus immersus RN42 TaxID=1160509 RepID=A0A3N4IA93_ASCIM|nr:hypothetical protein BJ508DRAFT_375246 [Ascobolus immersus RN42]